MRTSPFADFLRAPRSPARTAGILSPTRILPRGLGGLSSPGLLFPHHPRYDLQQDQNPPTCNPIILSFRPSFRNHAASLPCTQHGKHGVHGAQQISLSPFSQKAMSARSSASPAVPATPATPVDATPKPTPNRTPSGRVKAQAVPIVSVSPLFHCSHPKCLDVVAGWSGSTRLLVVTTKELEA